MLSSRGVPTAKAKPAPTPRGACGCVSGYCWFFWAVCVSRVVVRVSWLYSRAVCASRVVTRVAWLFVARCVRRAWWFGRRGCSWRGVCVAHGGSGGVAALGAVFPRLKPWVYGCVSGYWWFFGAVCSSRVVARVAACRAVYPRLKACLPRHLGGLIATLLASPQKQYRVIDVAACSRVSGSA